jgi:hypothetical protein
MTAHKIEDIKMKQNNSYEIRTALLEQTCSNINQTLIRLEKKMDDGFSKADSQFFTLDKKIESKFDMLDKKIDSKFEIIDKKIDSIHSRIWHLFLCGVHLRECLH